MKRASVMSLLVSLALVSACGTRVEQGPAALAPGALSASGSGGVAAAAPQGQAIPAGEASGAGGSGSPAAAASPATPAAALAGGATKSAAASSTPSGGAATPTTTKVASGETGTTPGTSPVPKPPDGAPKALAGTDHSPFVIGSVGTLSGPVGTSLKPGVDALQAWSKWTNDRGGINGHPVSLTVADDGGDPARHRALVQEFVERRGVMAFVHNAEAVSGKGSEEYLAAKGIPVIGSDSGSEYFNTNPNYFPQVPSSSGMLLGMLGGTANIQVPQGKTKLGILVCSEVQVCRDANRLWPENAEKYGLHVVYKGQVSIAQPDFTAECLAARNAGVDVLIFGLPSSNEQRVAASCARQGIKLTYSLAAPDPAERLTDDPNLNNNAILGFNAFPWTASDTPATTEFQQVMAKYLGQGVGGAHAYGWISGKLFEKAAATVTGPASTEGILKGLWSLKNETLGGLTVPLTFTQDKPASLPVCWFEMRIKDGKWLALSPEARCRN